MQFLGDMGIALDVINALRNAGWDAVHLREQGLQCLPDDQILEKGRMEGRIVLVHDLDFGRILALSGASKPSIITFRLSDMRPPSVILKLFLSLAKFEKELEEGAALTITDLTIRCRMLPIRTNII